MKRQAYSIIELIVVVLFLAAFAAVAIPRLNFSRHPQKAKPTALAGKIVTDLRRTRTLAHFQCRK